MVGKGDQKEIPDWIGKEKRITLEKDSSKVCVS